VRGRGGGGDSSVFGGPIQQWRGLGRSVRLVVRRLRHSGWDVGSLATAFDAAQ
jgi:hypothetical protein